MLATKGMRFPIDVILVCIRGMGQLHLGFCTWNELAVQGRKGSCRTGAGRPVLSR